MSFLGLQERKRKSIWQAPTASKRWDIGLLNGKINGEVNTEWAPTAADRSKAAGEETRWDIGPHPENLIRLAPGDSQTARFLRGKLNPNSQAFIGSSLDYMRATLKHVRRDGGWKLTGVRGRWWLQTGCREACRKQRRGECRGDGEERFQSGRAASFVERPGEQRNLSESTGVSQKEGLRAGRMAVLTKSDSVIVMVGVKGVVRDASVAEESVAEAKRGVSRAVVRRLLKRDWGMTVLTESASGQDVVLVASDVRRRGDGRRVEEDCFESGKASRRRHQKRDRASSGTRKSQ